GTDYAIHDVSVIQLNEGAAMLSYQLVMKSPDKGKDISPSHSSVSSAWVRRDGKWLSVFRQRVPVESKSVPSKSLPSDTSGTLDAALTPTSVRYIYKGTTKLEDIHVTLQLFLGQAKIPLQVYWGTWQPGEIKEISLGLLAAGVEGVERIDFSAKAMRNGKKVS